MRIGKTIYLDHQATTPLDSRVFDSMSPYFGEAFGNPHSADHVMGWASARAVEDSAAKIAALLDADSDEIVFTSGATEANNLALLGLARRSVKGTRRRILCSAIEHKSVLAAARAARDSLEYELELIGVDRTGKIDIEDLQRRLRDDVLLVSIVLVNNEIGTIQEISEIAKAVSDVGAILHCDAAQAPCAINLCDAGRTADMLSLSGHKMYGPKGIGALFVRRELQDRLEPIIYGGGQQQNLRSGTIPTPLCVGMGKAAELLQGDNAASERDSVRALRDRFLKGLAALEWTIKLNGPSAAHHPGNANVRFEGFSAHDILAALQPKVAASTGSACTSGIPEASHVLRAIGLSDEHAQSSIRFSVGRYTTADDVDEAVEKIGEALSCLSDANVKVSASLSA
jgi:cysteine desulfurase